MSKIIEGKCEFILPDDVFFNPVQEFNRDLTVLIINSFIHFLKNSIIHKEKLKIESGLSILDAFSATGLRAVRYAKELPNIGCVIANDLSTLATQVIAKNIDHNGLSQDIIKISNEEANLLMLKNHSTHKTQIDVIDIDPYGSAAPFLDATMRAISNGGLVCVTCTDMGVLCGATGHNCYAKYDSIALHTKYAHEMSLRIVLHSLESHANKHNKYIVPLVSVSVDFYVRLFVRVYESAAQVHLSPSKRSLVYHCNGCHSYYMQPLALLDNNNKFKHSSGPSVSNVCQICSSSLILGGPVWNGLLHDKSFVDDLLKSLPDLSYLGTQERILGILTLISEELPDVPLYYKMDKMTSSLQMSVPKSTVIKSAILNAGYRVSISHCDPGSIKTDAPLNVLWGIFTCWIQSGFQNTPFSHPEIDEI
ncbi:unnamed protein product [Gordionus sp. m RMFG-2023]|uniref:tRNA (guanine(26)-N(2))-dimethyltransferase-like isoform X2 n=1 Tax=Gordionus sp. m RMFG-2023 TaxID=3053472 RepID=UPI0030E075C4